jgi:hypothetical protein
MRPRPSDILSVAAVFIALGGTSYAAISLPRASVGHRELKPDAVSSTRIADRSIKRRDLARDVLAGGQAGPQGPKGDPGPQGLPGPGGGSLGAGQAQRTVAGVRGCNSADIATDTVKLTEPSRLFVSYHASVANYAASDRFWLGAVLRQGDGGNSAVLPLLDAAEQSPGKYQLMSGAAFAVSSSGPATLPPGTYTLHLYGLTGGGTCTEDDVTNWANGHLSWIAMPAD